MLLNPDDNSVIPIFKCKKLRHEHFDPNHIGSRYRSLVLNPGTSGLLLDADKYGNNSVNYQEVRPVVLPSGHRLSQVDGGQRYRHLHNMWGQCKRSNMLEWFKQ